MNIDDEKLEAEMREIFRITDDPAPTESADTGSSANSDEEDQNANTSTPTENASAADTDDAPEATEKNNSESAPVEPADTENALPGPEEKFTKQNAAFAQMRVQNKELSNLLMDLAKATGQNPQNIDEAQELLRNSLTTVVAKDRNIPEDVLREMDQNKRELAELKQSQARQKAIAGFQAVKERFALTNAEINSFADKLIENKLNPFEQDLDLVKEYRNLYYDTLIEKAREEGVQSERARSLKAQNSSTTPSTRQGTPENTGNQAKPINSVKELNDLLDSLVTK